MHCSPKWARRGLLSTSTLSFNVMSVLNSASCGMFYSGSLPYSKWVRRQRAFLQSDGRWTSHEAGERRPFLCVEKIEECELGENREGNWLFRDGEDYQNIPSETTAMPKGTILHLRCSTSWVISIYFDAYCEFFSTFRTVEQTRVLSAFKETPPPTGSNVQIRTAVDLTVIKGFLSKRFNHSHAR